MIIKKKVHKTNFVYAVWDINTLPAELSEFHISQGENDDEQGDGYFPDDDGATLHIAENPNKKFKYLVTFIAPSCGLERCKGMWLSPSCVNDETEARVFGIQSQAGEVLWSM